MVARAALATGGCVLLAVTAGCINLGALGKPEDCSASGEVDNVDVDVDCSLNGDGEYDCECDGGSSTEFTVREFCELEDDEQEDIIDDECELDDVGEGEGEGEGECGIGYTFGGDSCSVDLTCSGGLTRDIDCTILSDGVTAQCSCSENGFSGFGFFENEGFCDLVADGDAAAEQQVRARIDVGCDYEPSE